MPPPPEIVMNIANRLATHHYLIVPGWNGSGEDHWQSHWQSRLPDSSRIAVQSWSDPQREDWVAALESAVQRASRPVVLIAHSLGCITVAHWAARQASDRNVVGALLVAPADVERWDVDRRLSGFAPIPACRLPFPSLVVGSTNDHAARLERIQHFANSWHSACHIIHGAGHINTASGHTRWEDGINLLACLGLPSEASVPTFYREDRRNIA